MEVTRAGGGALDDAVPGSILVEGPGRETEKLDSPDLRRLTLQVADRETTRLRAEVEGFWSPAQIVLPNGEPIEVRCPLFPAGRLQGRLELTSGEPMPGALEVTFEPSMQRRPGKPHETQVEPLFPRSTESCPVSDLGTWICEVPAGLLDLRLRVPGFIGHYLWETKVRAGEGQNLGTLTLQRGASLVGWVVTADSTELGEGAEASLLPTTASSSFPATAVPRMSQLSQRVSVEPRGFFHFQGVAPGSYTVRVEHQGFAPAQLAPIPVLEGRETHLPQPLVLDRPVRFELSIAPPVDPYGHPWEASLLSESDSGAHEGVVGSDGLWSAEGLSPGSYRLRVHSGRGRYRFQWLSEALEVEPQMPVHEVRMPLVEIWGRIRLAGKPLEATLLFGGRHGGQKILLDSDEEGLFAGFLPHAGEWPLVVYSEATGWRSLKAVSVTPLWGSRRVELDIAVPDTSITGRVLDSEGGPLEEARVSVFHLEVGRELDEAVADGDGRFRLVGVAPGRVVVTARDGSRAKVSEAIFLDLQEHRPPAPITLVVQDLLDVSGKVIASTGPVPGVQIHALPRVPGRGFALVQPTILTGTDGRFRFQAPGGSLAVDLLVLPPGFAARIVRVPLPVSREVSIPVDQVAGTLIFDLGSFGLTSEDRARLSVRLMQGEASVGAALLGSWARFQSPQNLSGRRWVIPGMSPGDYTLCVPLKATPRTDGGQASPGPTEACVSGWLPPQGELVLGHRP